MKVLCNKVFKNYILLMITMFATELVFRYVVKAPIIDWAVLRIFLGINVISLLFSLLLSFVGRIVGNIICFLISLASSIYAIAQVGFLNYLGVYISFGTSSQAGAVKDYIGDYLASFEWNYYLILIPTVVLLLFYIFFDRKIERLRRNDQIDFSDKFDSEDRKKDNQKNKKKEQKADNLGSRVLALLFIGAFGFGYYYSLTAEFMQNELQLKSTKELFLNPDMPNIAVSQFGTNVFVTLDVKNVLFPTKEEEKVIEFQKEEQIINDYTRYIDDTLWNKVIENEKNKTMKTLHNYYSSKAITEKNDYTGMFKDKNLIVIMMESTNTILLNPDYYPNMYKLYTEGWSWDNAYSPRNACSTGNNEMSGMVSLFTINNVCTANIYRNNKYPEAIFNLFNNAGYTTTSYHNYTEHYYYRKVYHPNMGSGKYYGVQALGIPYSNVYQEWPSDVALVEKVLEKTKDQEKFMAWMTTVSAHQPYTQYSKLGDKHIALFKSTKYNTSLKRYMSKLKEFDLAIGALIEGLEEQGKLQDTVIVMYSDHYPYGLTNQTLNTYFDYNVGTQRNVDRTPFVIYNSELTGQKFDEYTTYMNIVPTVANLFGLDYDPRLYAGFDILSDSYENRVVFADGSWKDPVAYYNASNGKITYHQANVTYTKEEIKAINDSIDYRISMSNLAIKKDYFNYLEKEKKKYVVEEPVIEDTTTEESPTKEVTDPVGNTTTEESPTKEVEDPVINGDVQTSE